MRVTGRKGFTLIELLIVVAIIAILAAIAVPNFLEAQVRAKVSRVKADQRSLATAIEAYVVDNNRPPITYFDGFLNNNPPYTSADLAQAKFWTSLTTPVSYMSVIPKDPFAAQGDFRANVLPPSGYDMYKHFVTTVFVGTKSRAREGFYPAGAAAFGFSWYIESFGPSMRGANKSFYYTNWYCCRTKGTGGYAWKGATSYTKTWGSPVDAFYDPTNGTVSFGVISRTNKGIPEGGSCNMDL